VKGRAELHFHLLPGVDDGPRSLGESLELARAAKADGTRTIVATPCVREVVVEELPVRVTEVNLAMAEAGIEIHALVGGELGLDDLECLGRAELETLSQGPAGDRWLLVEAPFSGGPDRLRSSIRHLRDLGFGAVIAHPERSRILDGADPARLWAELVSDGALLQVNAGSFLGRYGQGPSKCARRLLELDLVAAISSDAHGPLQSPSLGAAFSALSALAGAPRANRLVNFAPRALLTGFSVVAASSSS
jgi:protein-tyrosine phosphatase